MYMAGGGVHVGDLRKGAIHGSAEALPVAEAEENGTLAEPELFLLRVPRDPSSNGFLQIFRSQQGTSSIRSSFLCLGYFYF